MQDYDGLKTGEAEVERVRRHVNAVRERIRLLNQTAHEAESHEQSELNDF